MNFATAGFAAAAAAVLTWPATSTLDVTGEAAKQWLWPSRAPHHVAFPTTPAELPPPFIVPPPAEPAPPVVETKKPEPKPPEKPKTKRPTVTPKEPEKRKPKVTQRTLPSCALIRREYDRMSYGERLAAYARATPAEVAHGKRCLGM